jgi:hypothetical protein
MGREHAKVHLNIKDHVLLPHQHDKRGWWAIYFNAYYFTSYRATDSARVAAVEDTEVPGYSRKVY